MEIIHHQEVTNNIYERFCSCAKIEPVTFNIVPIIHVKYIIQAFEHVGGIQCERHINIWITKLFDQIKNSSIESFNNSYSFNHKTIIDYGAHHFINKFMIELKTVMSRYNINEYQSNTMDLRLPNACCISDKCPLRLFYLTLATHFEKLIKEIIQI